jgi:hypothetical protein
MIQPLQKGKTLLVWFDAIFGTHGNHFNSSACFINFE